MESFWLYGLLMGDLGGKLNLCMFSADLKMEQACCYGLKNEYLIAIFEFEME